MGAGSQDRRHVERICPGRVVDVQVAVEFVGEPLVEVYGDRIEGTSRHVHLVARKDALVVGHGQGVAELDAKGQAALGGDLLQRADQLHCPLVPQVVLKDSVRDAGLGKAEVVVEDASHSLPAQQGRVQLDKSVQAALFDQVAGNAFDLLGRAAVHGGQGDVVRDSGRDLDVS